MLTESTASHALRDDMLQNPRYLIYPFGSIFVDLTGYQGEDLIRSLP
jgi:hypothetical protein